LRGVAPARGSTSAILTVQYSTSNSAIPRNPAVYVPISQQPDSVICARAIVLADGRYRRGRLSPFSLFPHVRVACRVDCQKCRGCSPLADARLAEHNCARVRGERSHALLPTNCTFRTQVSAQLIILRLREVTLVARPLRHTCCVVQAVPQVYFPVRYDNMTDISATGVIVLVRSFSRVV